MTKKKLFIIGIIILIVIICVVFFLFIKSNRVIRENELPDNLKFKEQYESLNDKKDKVGNNYLKVIIAENNPIIYKTDREILDILTNETAIIFFGYESDPWSRNVIDPLLQMAKDNGIDKIYYVNIENIRDTYKIVDGKVEMEKKGTDAYYKILDFLGDKLDTYYIYEKNKKYNTKSLRLEAATVISVKDGKILGYHNGTINDQSDPYIPLTTKQREDMLDIYQKIYEPINKNFCPSDGC